MNIENIQEMNVQKKNFFNKIIILGIIKNK